MRLLHLSSRARRGPLCALAVSGLLWTAGCFGGGGNGGEGNSAATPPARSGTLWTIRDPGDQTSVPGSIVAFVNGVHVMVIDGDRVYAGMTELTAASSSDGARTLTFPSGLSASLVPSAEGAEMRFASGERVMVSEQQAPAGGEE